MSSSASRLGVALAATALSAALLVGCGGQNPFEAGAAVTTATAPAVADNDFLPEEQNLSDCVGAVQRPGCGSSAKGGWRQYLTMAVLVGGLAFIGWRIAAGVRARDAVANAPVANDDAGGRSA